VVLDFIKPVSRSTTFEKSDISFRAWSLEAVILKSKSIESEVKAIMLYQNLYSWGSEPSSAGE
jgi:hypothetical protein